MTETNMFEIDDSVDSQVAQWYKRLMNQVLVIDEKLDAGSEAATKRKFTTDLMNSYEEDWSANAERIKKGLGEYIEAGEIERFAATYLGLVRTLTNSFSKQYNEYIEKKVAEFPEPEDVEKVSAEERGELSKERSELAKQIKTIVDMAKTFNEPNADAWVLPVRKGSGGPRGKRALYEYTWTVDGQEMPEDDDNPKGVAVLLGFKLVSEFTQALRDLKINTTKPEPEFTVELNGKTVTASREEVEETEVSTEETPGESE